MTTYFDKPLDAEISSLNSNILTKAPKLTKVSITGGGNWTDNYTRVFRSGTCVIGTICCYGNPNLSTYKTIATGLPVPVSTNMSTTYIPAGGGAYPPSKIGVTLEGNLVVVSAGVDAMCILSGTFIYEASSAS